MASRSARVAEQASSSVSAPPKISYVLIDGLVVLKVIKHCQEGDDTELLQGVLLGLLVDDRLEITNCFPFPRHSEDEDFDEITYQMDMMRNLRQVNIDHLHVGWYQSTFYGAFLNKALLDSQFNYQNSIEESVVLIYDPLKTSGGFLSLKAYRLTPTAMEQYNKQDFTQESIIESGLSYQNMFDEIPVKVRNSHLVNALNCELKDLAPQLDKHQFLDLATSSSLERQLRMLMESVDELSQDSNKYNNYQRQLVKQQQMKQQHSAKRALENAAREARGEAPLPEEDLNKLFKPLPSPNRMDSLLISGQISNYCQEVNRFASQSLGKMFMLESLQDQ